MTLRRTLTLAAVALFAIATTAPAATIIYSDPLNGSSAGLNGTSPDDRGGTGTADWTANSRFNQDGSLTGGSGNGAAWLPFTPAQGFIYTLSADVNVGDNENDRWISLGFGDQNSDAAFFSDPPKGYGHILYKPSRGSDAGQVFPGWGTSATSGETTFDPADSGAVALGVRLDTTGASSADWTLEFFVGNTSISGPTTLSAVGGAGNLNEISVVGLTHQIDSNGTIKNFTLTQVIPEPTSLALLGLGGVMVLARRRHR